MLLSISRIWEDFLPGQIQQLYLRFIIPVARTLLDAGYTGGFINTPLIPDILEKKAKLPPPPPPPRTFTTPWPTYTHKPCGGLLYPSRLQIHSSPIPNHHFEFILNLPGPAVLPLHHFLEHSIKIRDCKDLLALLFIWTRSFQMTEFSNTALALMVIQFMQHTQSTPSPFDLSQIRDCPYINNETKRPFTCGWVEHEYQLMDKRSSEWLREPTWIPTNFGSCGRPAESRSVGVLFYEFLKFWSRADAFTRTFIVAVHSGSNQTDLQPRQFVYSEPQSSDVKIEHRRSDPRDLSQQPYWWRYQRLIIQDPFVPTFNHAETVSNSTVRYFAHNCDIAARSLGKAHPLASVFGRDFVPPRRVDEFERVQDRTWTTPKFEFLKRDEQLGYGTVGKEASGRQSMLAVNGSEGSDRGSGFSLEARGLHTSAELREGLGELCKTMEPPEPVLRLRRKTIQRVQEVITKEYGEQYTVELFGSTRYGVSSANSDLDLVIVDQWRPNGFPPGVELTALPRIYNIRRLGAFFYHAGFKNIQVISGASVPIVKFKDPFTGLECDINVNNQLGLLNSELIKRYCDISPLLRPMLTFIKKWAKPLGLNSPRVGAGPVTFSSYALVLMTIGFLQIRGLLPNLQQDLPPLPGNTVEGTFWVRHKSKRVKCDIRYHKAEGWVQPEEKELDKMLLDWFTYWGEEHRYSEQILSIRHGGLVRRPLQTKTEGKSKRRAETGDVELESESGQEPEPEVELEPEAISITSDADAEDVASASQDTIELIGHEPEVELEPEAISITSDTDAEDVVLASQDTTEHIASEATAIRELSDQEDQAIMPTQDEEMPKGWKSKVIVVSDPFLRVKNVTGNINRASLIRFELDCQRAAAMLSWGSRLEDVIPAVVATPPKSMGKAGRGKPGSTLSPTGPAEPNMVIFKKQVGRAEARGRTDLGPSSSSRTPGESSGSQTSQGRVHFGAGHVLRLADDTSAGPSTSRRQEGDVLTTLYRFIRDANGRNTNKDEDDATDLLGLRGGRGESAQGPGQDPRLDANATGTLKSSTDSGNANGGPPSSRGNGGKKDVNIQNPIKSKRQSRLGDFGKNRDHERRATGGTRIAEKGDIDEESDQVGSELRHSHPRSPEKNAGEGHKAPS